MVVISYHLEKENYMKLHVNSSKFEMSPALRPSL